MKCVDLPAYVLMDMAMSDFDGAREYLTRHRIHEMWEACVAELILRRSSGKEEITQTIVEVVEAAERRKTNPTRRILFVIGLSGTGLLDICKEVAGSTMESCSLVVAQPSDTYRTVSIQAMGAPRDIIVVAGFPRSITEALSFESMVCDIARCVVFRNKDDVHDSQTYLEHVNPVSAYYSALGKTTEVLTNDPKVSPLAALRNEIDNCVAPAK